MSLQPWLLTLTLTLTLALTLTLTLALTLTLTLTKAGGKRVSAAPTFSLRAGAAAGVFSGAQDTAQWLSMLEQCAEQVA